MARVESSGRQESQAKELENHSSYLSTCICRPYFKLWHFVAFCREQWSCTIWLGYIGTPKSGSIQTYWIQSTFWIMGSLRRENLFCCSQRVSCDWQERVQSSSLVLLHSSPCSPLLQVHAVALPVAPPHCHCEQGLLQITLIYRWLYFLEHGGRNPNPASSSQRNLDICHIARVMKCS